VRPAHVWRGLRPAKNLPYGPPDATTQVERLSRILRLASCAGLLLAAHLLQRRQLSGRYPGLGNRDFGGLRGQRLTGTSSKRAGSRGTHPQPAVLGTAAFFLTCAVRQGGRGQVSAIARRFGNFTDAKNFNSGSFRRTVRHVTESEVLSVNGRSPVPVRRWIKLAMLNTGLTVPAQLDGSGLGSAVLARPRKINKTRYMT